MAKLYSTHIKKITHQLIIASMTLHDAGKLPEAASMIKKTGVFFLPEYAAKPNNKSFKELKNKYDQTQNIITTSMIEAMQKKLFN